MRLRPGRPQYPFLMRDAPAALYLITALTEQGYKYADPIFNFPSHGVDLTDVDDTYLGENDLIVLTTRPPMHDWEVGERKGFKRSFTTTEQKLFRALGKSIQSCTRVEVVLTPAAAATSPEVARRRSNWFYQFGSTYRRYGDPVTRKFVKVQPSDARTAVFLIYEAHAWPGGPGLLAAFGMGGTETLVWCQRLAKEYRHLLCTTPFVMAEMRTGPVPERPHSMDFARTWEVTILGPTASLASHDPPHVE
jgi:hypothetical protein